MIIHSTTKNNIVCAVIESDTVVITDAQSALDILMTAKYEAGTKNIVIHKELITEDFFILSRGLAGEVLADELQFMAIIRTTQVNPSKTLSMRAIEVKMFSLLPRKMKPLIC